MQAFDMLKLIPLLVVACLPGGSVLMTIIIKFLPSSLPLAFKRVPCSERGLD